MTPTIYWLLFSHLCLVTRISNALVNGFQHSRHKNVKEQNFFNKRFPYFTSDKKPLFSPSPYHGSNRDDFDSSSNSNCHLRNNPFQLNWNFSALMSQDPSTKPKLIALMDVYNAAVEELEIPQSLDYTGTLSMDLAPFRRFVRKYSLDMGHDGRFTVFGCENKCSSMNGNNAELVEKNGDNFDSDDGASLLANVVFNMDDPLAYIRDVLSFRDNHENARPWSSSRNVSSGETVIFIPGLHTLHEHKEPYDQSQWGNELQCRQRTATERLKYYSSVLEGLPIAQLHTGTYLDQKDLIIKLTPDTMNALNSFGLLSSKNAGRRTRGDIQDKSVKDDSILCRLRTKDLDIIRIILSAANDESFCVPLRNRKSEDNEQLQRTLIQLIDTAARSCLKENSSTSESHLVLITYSATCNVLASALREWKNQATIRQSHDPTFFDRTSSTSSDYFSDAEAESLLRKSLTIVTIGGLCNNYIDGPAYIHVSMHDDILASSFGVSQQKSDPEFDSGGGKDAVYLRGLSPYAPNTSPSGTQRESGSTNQFDVYRNDAHNMDACAIQYLSLIRRINGITSFRQIYDLANEDDVDLDIKASLFALNYNKVGQLEMPPHLDGELLPSMIRATGGERWLWNPGFQLGEEGVDGSESPLPSLSDAEAELTQQFGYGVYDEIVDECR